MAEYIEREAALKVLRGKAVAKYPSTFYMGLFAAANEVGEIPAADVVEVVRCKDCKHQEKVWNSDKRMKDGGYWVYGCKRNQDQFVTHTVDGYDDDFCSYGERRSEK